MAMATLSDTVIDELVAICGADHVFTGASALFNRARVPAPFPAHRWEEYIPQAVVLPSSAISAATTFRIPISRFVAVSARPSLVVSMRMLLRMGSVVRVEMARDTVWSA